MKICLIVLILSWFSVGYALDINQLIERAITRAKPLFEAAQRNGGFRRSRQRQADHNARGMGASLATDKDDMTKILGQFSLDQLGFCKDNNQICNFLSCNAENFQESEDFSNLMLASKVLTNPDLRKEITGDASVMNMVCGTAKMDAKACALFKDGFKMIDQFLSMFEQQQARIEKGRRAALRRNMGKGGAHNLHVRPRIKREDDDDDDWYYVDEDDRKGAGQTHPPTTTTRRATRAPRRRTRPTKAPFRRLRTTTSRPLRGRRTRPTRAPLRRRRPVSRRTAVRRTTTTTAATTTEDDYYDIYGEIDKTEAPKKDCQALLGDTRTI